MVFLALPALQRSQRDLARKNDVRNLMAAIQNFRSNNRGQVPWNSHNDAWTKLEAYYKPSGHLNPRIDTRGREKTHVDTFSNPSFDEEIVGFSKSTHRNKDGDWIIAKGVSCKQIDGGGYVFAWGRKYPSNSIAIAVKLETMQMAKNKGWPYCVDTQNSQ